MEDGIGGMFPMSDRIQRRNCLHSQSHYFHNDVIITVPFDRGWRTRDSTNIQIDHDITKCDNMFFAVSSMTKSVLVPRAPVRAPGVKRAH